MDEYTPLSTLGNSALLIIGEPLIDSEHKALLSLLQELHAPVDPGVIHDDFLAKFGKLGCELARHFVHEEALMQSLPMPKEMIARHVYAHERIIEKYVEINVDLMHGKRYPKEELLPMIREWILGHIQTCDTKIKPFIDKGE